MKLVTGVGPLVLDGGGVSGAGQRNKGLFINDVSFWVEGIPTPLSPYHGTTFSPF